MLQPTIGRGVSVMFSKRVMGSAGVAGAMLVLGACTTPHVRYDSDARANLASYHSYVWEQPEVEDGTLGGRAFKNPLNEQRLRDAVDAQLAARGLQPAAEGSKPDAYVTVAIGTRRSLERDHRYPVRMGFGFGMWRPGFGSSLLFYDDDFYDYREGRISVNLYDATARKPIWYAAVEQDLSYLTGDQAAQRIDTVVTAMFAKFPVAGPGSTTK
jgi:Domain of unknown function (DUF4136)